MGAALKQEIITQASTEGAEEGAKALGGLPPLRHRELLGFPAAWLTHLPVPTTLRLRVPGLAVDLRVELAPEGHPRPEPEVPEIVFSAREWDAIVTGVQADRVRRSELLGWCRRKLSEPGFQVSEATALDGAQPDTAALWELSRVLRRLGVSLHGVELEEAREAGETLPF